MEEEEGRRRRGEKVTKYFQKVEEDGLIVSAVSRVVDNGVSPILLLQDLIHHVAIETAVACNSSTMDHAGVYGGRSLRPVAAWGYPHKPPPQQVVYHQRTPPGHGFYILVHENTISFYPLAVESSDWRCCLLLLPNGEEGPQTHGMKAVKFSANL